jgi:hypothetical protein
MYHSRQDSHYRAQRKAVRANQKITSLSFGLFYSYFDVNILSLIETIKKTFFSCSPCWINVSSLYSSCRSTFFTILNIFKILVDLVWYDWNKKCDTIRNNKKVLFCYLSPEKFSAFFRKEDNPIAAFSGFNNLSIVGGHKLVYAMRIVTNIIKKNSLSYEKKFQLLSHQLYVWFWIENKGR